MSEVIWREEAPTWTWDFKGSLIWLSDLLSGIIQTHQALGEESELLSWQKEAAKSSEWNDSNHCGQIVMERNKEICPTISILLQKVQLCGLFFIISIIKDQNDLQCSRLLWSYLPRLPIILSMTVLGLKSECVDMATSM